MQPKSEHADILRQLEQIHFDIQYNPRNLRNGRGHGSRGVGDERLIQTYLQGMEMLYRAITSPPWSRPELTRRIVVQVPGEIVSSSSITDPFTWERDGIPYIALPCRTSDPTWEAERQWALATAVHEATHVFNYQQRPFSSPYSAPWAWFDEALAVFMEMQLFTDYRDHFRFLGDWIEKPEISLDDPAAYYQAGQFVAYLAERMGVEFINRVWMESAPSETPIEAITRLLPEGQTFVSADPDVRDLFASGYCLDSWFLNDPASPAYHPELHARYGEQAITESFVLGSSQEVGTNDLPDEQDMLSHLACRYYRFYVEKGIKQLNVELHASDETRKSPLKAELAAVTKEHRCMRVIPLRPDARNPDGRTLFRAEVKPINLKKLDHFMLVVTNCGIRAFKPPHDDGKRYTIKASAR